MIVPMPLHWRKRWQRGFNQAELLAREIGRAHPRTRARNALRRVREHARAGWPDQRQAAARMFRAPFAPRSARRSTASAFC